MLPFRTGFDRLVEDLIQEAISKGEFSNLPGSGKPLSSNQNINPYVDFVTYKLNQVNEDNAHKYQKYFTRLIILFIKIYILLVVFFSN